MHLTLKECVFELPLEGDSADFGHIELKNNLIPHQNYRNRITFMEAELASIKDLGYGIDLIKTFFDFIVICDIMAQ